MIRRPPRSTLSSSSAASDVYKRQFLLFMKLNCLVRDNCQRSMHTISSTLTYNHDDHDVVAHISTLRLWMNPSASVPCFQNTVHLPETGHISRGSRSFPRNRHQECSLVLASHGAQCRTCLLYTSPSPRDRTRSRMPSSA
eukprot:TRINITY_DN1079_c0_g1_i2.p1 TRINITY_DN1079_c0_g1~~TRINITY_DN1079_c0_g1_i2.p1  ORF type:complete len:140 (-),score=4.47 TRINITY_DN1079_c0_g1_i2:28-447(-)